MCQATLRTGRLRLVPLSEEHLEYEVELDADPEVMRYLGDGRACSREDVELRHQHRLAAARRVVGLGFWVGFVDGQFVGWGILEPPERVNQGPIDGQAELGCRLLRRSWRKGLASEGAAWTTKPPWTWTHCCRPQRTSRASAHRLREWVPMADRASGRR